jgi:hypothetical protein
MKTQQDLDAALSRYSAEKLDFSSRGSGLNAVWKIRIDNQPAVLKTYASRRGPAQTFLSNIEHLLTGRTPYAAAARQRTERENLAAWRQLGLDVPRIIDHPFDPPIPLPHLCMEYVEGRRIPELLADPQVPPEEKDRAFERFVKAWEARHAAAEARRDPRLVQEHATLDHVMIGGSRVVTFDLEVSYTSPEDVRSLVAREIGGYVLSLFKKLPEPQAGHFLELLLTAYPAPSRLDATVTEFLDNPHPWRRFIHRLDFQRARARGQTMNKFEAARRLQSALKRRGTAT